MIRFILFILLIGVPIAEIAVFLTVGSIIGVLPTILIIILTAVVGATLLKRQGVSALAKLQADMQAKRVPAAALGEAVTVAIAGLLLLTPGFITDAVGFALFVPKVRSYLWRRISGSVKVLRPGSGMRGGSGMGPGGGPGPDPGGRGPRQRTHARTIDLEEGEYKSAEGSPWRDRPDG